MMIACYDLARCPPTYDAVAFLALAEAERLRRGEQHIDVHILPGPLSGFRRDGLGTWPHTVEGRVASRDRILVPLCRLLPLVRSVEVCVNRTVVDCGVTRGNWGAGEYLVGLPRIVEALRAGPAGRPLRAPSPIRKSPENPLKWITFTLREAEHHPLRNSRTEEWVLAAGELAQAGYTVAIIRDSAKSRDPLHGDFCRNVGQVVAPAEDLAARAAVYAGADLNVGICNGPMWMSIFMDAPTLMLRPTTSAMVGGCYDDAFYARHGVPRGSQLPGSPPHQRLCWEEDTCANIVRAVEDMLEYCAANGERPPRGAAGTTIINDGRPT